MKVAIIGTGSMAALFAAKLAPHCEPIMVGSWQQHITTLNRSGLRLRAGDDERRVRVAASLDAADAFPADVALVLTKSYQTVEAAKRAALALADDGICITLQNGLGNREILEATLPGQTVVAGVTTEGATLLAPGIVRHAGAGVTALAPPAASPQFDSFLTLLRQAKFTIQLVADVDSLLWGKVAINSGINPLALLLGWRNGRLLGDDDVRLLMQATARETEMVARTLHIALPFPSAAAELQRVAAATAENQASMLQDYLRGAPTEIDAINGAVVRAAESVGVHAELNGWLCDLVTRVEGGDPPDRNRLLMEIRRHAVRLREESPFIDISDV